MLKGLVGVRGGRFNLFEELGRGSLRVVYFAKDDQDAEHAVKLIGPNIDDEVKERLKESGFLPSGPSKSTECSQKRR